MADFSTWQRATLEQFAREATEKLVADRAAIDELVGALERLVAYVLKQNDGHAFPMEAIPAQRAIIKHTQRKEQA